MSKREHIALMNVSGALMDSGEVVPGDTCQYGEAVRKITARAEAAESKLADLQRSVYESERKAIAEGERRAAAEAGLDEAARIADERDAAEARVKALEAKLAEAESRAATILAVADANADRARMGDEMLWEERARVKELEGALLGLNEEWLRHGVDCDKSRYGNSNAPNCTCGVREWNTNRRAALAAGRKPCPFGCGPAPGACHPGACACEGACTDPKCHAALAAKGKP